MHIYIITRGIIHETERFLRELSSQYLPYEKQMEFKKPDGTISWTALQPFALQVSVRPMAGIYEICFPEKHLDIMLQTLFGEPGKQKDGSGKTQHSKHQKWIWFLRKMLGIDPIPETWQTTNFIP